MQDVTLNTQPMILCVAPNGARKTKLEYPSLPISANELADTAASCQDAGASMLHIHVRDSAGAHSLDVNRYKAAICAIRTAIGTDMILQMSTESLGIFSAEQQINAVKNVTPEAVSIAIRELCPHSADEKQAAGFFLWLWREGIAPQYILYSVEDVLRFNDLLQRGVVPNERLSVLFVIGGHQKTDKDPTQTLSNFLMAARFTSLWMVCGFDSAEVHCTESAARLGGHTRVGFENNVLTQGGEKALDNAELVSQAARITRNTGRKIADAMAARRLLYE